MRVVSDRSLRSVGALRFRLTRFVTILQTYISEVVIQTQILQLRAQLEKAEDIDEMASIHDSYVKRLEAQALISKNVSAIKTAIMQVLELCAVFYDTQLPRRGRDNTAVVVRKQHRRHRSTLSYSDGIQDTEDEATGPSENNDEQGEYDADIEGKLATASKFSGPYQERIRKMGKEFDKLHAFIINGLHGVAKAGGEQCYEILAERLD